MICFAYTYKLFHIHLLCLLYSKYYCYFLSIRKQQSRLFQDRIRAIKSELDRSAPGKSDSDPIADSFIESKRMPVDEENPEEAESKDEPPIDRTAFSNYSITLTCFTPDGSPMQGRSFIIGSEGASIGRKPQSTICMCIKASEDPAYVAGMKNDPEKLLNIDSAVSTEHARIDMDPNTGEFYVTDGTSLKASTNGIIIKWIIKCLLVLYPLLT